MSMSQSQVLRIALARVVSASNWHTRYRFKLHSDRRESERKTTKELLKGVSLIQGKLMERH